MKAEFVGEPLGPTHLGEMALWTARSVSGAHVSAGDIVQVLPEGEKSTVVVRTIYQRRGASARGRGLANSSSTWRFVITRSGPTTNPVPR